MMRCSQAVKAIGFDPMIREFDSHHRSQTWKHVIIFSFRMSF